jgi:hypothetical protein
MERRAVTLLVVPYDDVTCISLFESRRLYQAGFLSSSDLSIHCGKRLHDIASFIKTLRFFIKLFF